MDNLRGATIMVLAMLGFAVEDMFIKLLAGSLPIGQIIGLMATGGAVTYALICRAQGLALFSRDMLTAPVLIRNFGGIVWNGRLCHRDRTHANLNGFGYFASHTACCDLGRCGLLGGKSRLAALVRNLGRVLWCPVDHPPRYGRF